VEWRESVADTWDRRAAACCEAVPCAEGGGEERNSTTLEDCLRLFTSPQALEGVACPSCGPPAPEGAGAPLAVPLAAFLSAEAGSPRCDGDLSKGAPLAPPHPEPPPSSPPPPPSVTKQTLDFHTTPRVLFVQLKRFGMRRKLTQPVMVPPELDLAPFVSGPASECRFVLSSCVCKKPLCARAHAHGGLLTLLRAFCSPTSPPPPTPTTF